MLSILRRHDWYLNGVLLILAAASLLTLYSVGRAFFLQQLIWFAIALAVIAAFSLIDWRPLVNNRQIIFGVYLAAVALLVITLFLAPAIRQAKSWLVFGPVQFQTSELAKLALIILFAAFFAKRHISIARAKNILISFLYLALPVGLVLLQPDLGTAIILTVIWIGFLFVSGIRWRHIVIGLAIFILLALVGWNYFLQDYHKDRIIGLFNPAFDPLGVNYSVIQAKIAIGSAGFWGKGFRQGTQVQLGFLPEAQADFIFAAFIEEWGLLGGLVIIAAFIFLISRLIVIGLNSQSNFARLTCLGAAILFLTQFILNVWSNIGLLPVVGVTFPFFSYGGSSLLTNAMLIGIIQSIAARRPF